MAVTFHSRQPSSSGFPRQAWPTRLRRAVIGIGGCRGHLPGCRPRVLRTNGPASRAASRMPFSFRNLASHSACTSAIACGASPTTADRYRLEILSATKTALLFLAPTEPGLKSDTISRPVNLTPYQFFLCFLLLVSPARAQVEITNSATTPAEKQETPFSAQVASYITALETRVRTLEEFKSSLTKTGRSELLGTREVLTAIHNSQARTQLSALVSLLRSEHPSARKHSCHLLGLLGDQVVAGPLLDTFKNDAQRPDKLLASLAILVRRPWCLP